MLHKSFLEIGPLVPEKILKGFYAIWTWLPFWSCDQHHVIKFLFTCIINSHTNLVKSGPVVSEKSMF